MRFSGLGVCVAGALMAAGCGGYGTALPPDGGTTFLGQAGTVAPSGAAGGGPDASSSTGAAGTVGTLPPPTATPQWQLVPELAGPCAKAAAAIDVNLGNRPEDFVRAAFCQVNGAEPSADV